MRFVAKRRDFYLHISKKVVNCMYIGTYLFLIPELHIKTPKVKYETFGVHYTNICRTFCEFVTFFYIISPLVR